MVHEPTGKIDYQSIIRGIRQKAQNRKYDRKHKVGLGLERFFGTTLSKQVKNTKRLVEEGSIVWGAIVQANTTLFQPGPHNCPGNILYSSDQRMDGRPNLFLNLAERLFSLKGTDLKNPELRKFANDLADERGRGGRLDIPLSLTNNVPCYMNDIQFERKHLPHGYLSAAFYPLLIHPNLPSVMVLPVWYWTKECRVFVEPK